MKRYLGTYNAVAASRGERRRAARAVLPDANKPTDILLNILVLSLMCFNIEGKLDFSLRYIWSGTSFFQPFYLKCKETELSENRKLMHPNRTASEFQFPTLK